MQPQSAVMLSWQPQMDVLETIGLPSAPPMIASDHYSRRLGLNRGKIRADSHGLPQPHD